jgi:hypothetical protein
MLNTTASNHFQIEVNDSTVSVLPGTARIGNSIIAFPGGFTSFDKMLHNSGDASGIYNVLLYLTDSSATVGGALPLTNGSAFLTTKVSLPAVATKRELVIPALPIDAGFPNPSYARGYPISLFTLFSPDGTHVTSFSHTDF